MGAFIGKTVLILDGSRGIGAAIVCRFITDRANARSTYVGSKGAAKHLAQETGATAILTDSAGRDTIIDTVRKSGALDILAVNAGIGVFDEALKLNTDDTDHPFKISIHTPYHASVEATRQMSEGEYILITGSVNGDHMPVAGMAVYTASKSALQGMARGLAHDFEPRGITTDVVQPGPIDTGANPTNGPIRDILHSLITIKKHG